MVKTRITTVYVAQKRFSWYDREMRRDDKNGAKEISTMNVGRETSVMWRNSGAGTIFQQGGQDQPFPAGGLGAL